MKHDWNREIEAASNWLSDQVKLAIDRAFPPDGLWGGTGAFLKGDVNMSVFRGMLAADIGETFERIGVDWRPAEPRFGSMRRVIGVDGRFVHTSIMHAMRMIGADEAIEHLPMGLAVEINPYRIVVRESGKHNPIGIDVSQYQGAAQE